ncbi:Oidioi.mRNA.OKI2018_I69.chr2.g7239.t1.cds [Oikopleura dioica]|uniref:Oidioi.mRNA.OKI2018_I69.chr2.g7239.t1.cds n=1 Tax=Oikopleura dioica TaxID=34765 RepID=A0ABN7TEL6_OIKDI|nr:Oidioi.mRNA.OKI2018_I69.chr2.g7239.t1.cds [Oikopleura dioica]
MVWSNNVWSSSEDSQSSEQTLRPTCNIKGESPKTAFELAAEVFKVKRLNEVRMENNEKIMRKKEVINRLFKEMEFLKSKEKEIDIQLAKNIEKLTLITKNTNGSPEPSKESPENQSTLDGIDSIQTEFPSDRSFLPTPDSDNHSDLSTISKTSTLVLNTPSRSRSSSLLSNDKTVPWDTEKNPDCESGWETSWETQSWDKAHSVW